MKKIALATHNMGKYKELGNLFAETGYELQLQSQFTSVSAEETGLSFIENAIIKARFLASFSGLPTLADDSGIEVDALSGAPGIYSARYAGPEASDQENLALLLEKMKNVEEKARTARFRCVMAFMRHATDPCPLVAMGTWEGVILQEPTGKGGFGYDPVFWVPSLGQSVAEMSKEMKNTYSHRAEAVRTIQKMILKESDRT